MARRELTLWEWATDFGEDILITKDEWTRRYGYTNREWERVKGRADHRLGYRVVDGGIVLYRGTAETCAKLLDAQIVKNELRLAYEKLRQPEDIRGVIERAHLDIDCPRCGEKEGINCSSPSGTFALHTERIRGGLLRRKALSGTSQDGLDIHQDGPPSGGREVLRAASGSGDTWHQGGGGSGPRSDAPELVLDSGTTLQEPAAIHQPLRTSKHGPWGPIVLF